jgi:hypothetical protein
METREIKISRETAERWYNGNDKELKELALQTYPELKPKYEVGKWYKGENGILFRCQKQGEPVGYGFGIYRFDFNTTWFAESFTEATHEEVEQRFKEEAKKRGYYDKPFVCLHRSNKPVEAYCGDSFWTTKGCVFDNGKWAEFAKESEYKIGEVYAFASSKKEFENGCFVVDTLLSVQDGACRFTRKNGGAWRYIRKIEYKFVD